MRRLGLFFFLLITCQFALADKAFDEVMVKAKAGDATAQHNLGIMYAKGQEVTQDYKQAFNWLTKAAEQGNAEAQLYLAVMYYQGQGVTQDYKQTFNWLTKAAEQGNAEAQSSLGEIYAKGQGVAQDYKKAFIWYKKAAEQGNDIAQYNLGRMYANAQGVTQDYDQAVSWYSKAAEQGNAEAKVQADSVTEIIKQNKTENEQANQNQMIEDAEAKADSVIGEDHTIGSKDDVWKKAPGTEIYVKTNGVYSYHYFRTDIVTNLPESNIVGAPQSVMTEVEGKCDERTFHVAGVLFFAEKNRGGVMMNSLPPEEIIRKVAKGSSFEKVFNMLCKIAREKK